MRNVSPLEVVPKHNEFACVVCKEQTVQKCSRCKSISYCSKECQISQWPSHKDICNNLKQVKKEVTDLLAKVLDKRGLFGMNEPTFVRGAPSGDMWEISFYVAKRVHYTHYLIKCGLENESKLAKELAVEHILDIFYIHPKIGAAFYELAACLLIDLERIDELVILKRQIKVFDESQNDVLSKLMRVESYKPFSYCIEFIIATDRLKQLRFRYATQFLNFLLGTHLRLGADSLILKIAGCTPVLRKIKEHWDQWSEHDWQKHLAKVFEKIEVAMEMCPKIWKMNNEYHVDIRVLLEAEYKKRICSYSLWPAGRFITAEAKKAGLVHPSLTWN